MALRATLDVVKWRTNSQTLIELLYPIYLDIPMMISVVATMDGGCSLEEHCRYFLVGMFEENKHISSKVEVKLP